MSVEPRCPHCNAQGVKHITAKTLGNAVIIFCGKCGAIFGVVPGQTSTPKAQPEKTEGLLPKKKPFKPEKIVYGGTKGMPDPIPHRKPGPDPIPHVGIVDNETDALSPEQASAMLLHHQRYGSSTNYMKFPNVAPGDSKE